MPKINNIELVADMENIGRLMAFIAQCARDQDIATDRSREIQLVLEEAFVNICKYAYAGEQGGVEVKYFSEGDRAAIEIIDSGVPFDITAQESPDILTDIRERQICGLGCLLIKNLTDTVVYRRENGKNILKLTCLLRP
jgi:serine/threonine-protein kinase RsbW